MAYPLDYVNSHTHGQHRELDIGEMMEHFKLHIHVRQDTSYAFQSRAYVEVWNEEALEWKRVSSIIPLEIADVYEAAAELRARAAAILLGNAP